MITSLPLVHEQVRGSLLVQHAQELIAKNNQPYLLARCSCPSGYFHANIWNHEFGISHCFDQPVIIEASVHHTRWGYELKKITFLRDDEINFCDFLPQGPCDEQLLWDELIDELRQRVKAHDYRCLLDYLLGDSEFCFSYQSCPASLKTHHPWRGGLVQHVMNCLRLSKDVVQLYDLDEDLLVMGIFLHDVGKLWEIDFLKNQYTREGELLGHLIQGVCYVKEVMNRIDELTQKRKTQLLHCLVSHHGSNSRGSPKHPMSPEANIVYMLDRLDAEMFQIQQGLMDVDEDHFSQTNALLKRRFYQSQSSHV